MPGSGGGWEEWGKFRRALPKDDRDRLDELFEMARHHAASAAYASSPKPMDIIFMAMFLEMLRRVERLEESFPELGSYEGCLQKELDL